MNLNKTFVIDIESNNLLNDSLTYKTQPYKLKEDAKLWVVVIKNIGTQEIFVAEKENITKEWFKEVLKECDTLIAHNGLKFDFPMLKLFGLLDYKIGYIDEESTLFENNCKFLDTLLISRMLNPDRHNGHSLESWGERVGEYKADYRQQCIDNNIIEKGSPKGQEFKNWNHLMKPYCVQDVLVTEKVFFKLLEELKDYSEFKGALKQETKLADLSWKREVLGFKFDKELALKNLEDLQLKMKGIADKINPILPPKKMNIGELKLYTPPKNQLSDVLIKETTPPKNQLKADGSLSSTMVNFITKVGAEYKEESKSIIYEGEEYILPLNSPLKNYKIPSDNLKNFANKINAEIVEHNKIYYFNFENITYTLPLEIDKPLKSFIKADIDDLDHVKMYLISLGWLPLEWRERDLTKDSKKQNIPYEKREKALRRWVDETISGKYKEQRLKEVGIKEEDLYNSLEKRLHEDKPVKVPTSPCIRTGVEKELCANLTKLGDKVAFAKDFALYLTFKHRKNSIAGGEIEDMDFDLENPNTGYLSMVREEDYRIPTPSIEVGAASHRFRHISVANIPRITSEFGKEMRSMFGCGEGYVQLGFDYSSLENRIQGHYVFPYEKGDELAKTLVAEKPLDLHTINSIKLGISRTDCKSVNYCILYGGTAPKIAKMLSKSKDESEIIYNDFWAAVPPLRQLKQDLEKEWESTGKKYIKSIDGRRINIRSKHSLLNFLFQSSGVIFTKYAFLFIFQELEKQGYNINPTENKIDISSMIEYHDECQIMIKQDLINYKLFNTEEEAKDFEKNYKEPFQLSAISKGKEKYYIALPNPISKAITNGIRKAEEFLNIRVPMGYEWVIGKNWSQCH